MSLKTKDIELNSEIIMIYTLYICIIKKNTKLITNKKHKNGNK